MDNNALTANVTVDDFDSIINVADEGQWTTPVPELPYNASASPWYAGTYHLTAVPGASLSHDFTGSALYIYGGAGPDYGSFSVSIDGANTTHSAHQNDIATQKLIYSNTNLAYGNHALVLSNLGALEGDNNGAQFAFDYLQSTFLVAPAGATVTNTTIEETDPRLVYNGTWVTNTPTPSFSGGNSKYTNEDGASVTLSFNGTVLYIYGDIVNDHGLYAITLDNRPAQTYNAIAGCGGVPAYVQRCEKWNTIAYFAPNLGPEEHRVTVRNIGGSGPNFTYFDLDAFIVTTPSEYLTLNATSTVLPLPAAASASASPSTSGTPSGARAQVGLPSGALFSSTLCLLLVFVGVFRGLSFAH